MNLPENVRQHYNAGNETNRLKETSLERLRTESILRRYLPPAPATVLDVGGGDGVYAFPLASQGYQVHLIDPIALHIEQAQEKNKKAQQKVSAMAVGDARALSVSDNFAEAVLYFGPLYHLASESDRNLALKEAFRVLKKGGIFIGAYISQFTSLIDGVRANYFGDPVFFDIVKKDLKTGPHTNPNNHPGYFTDAFFHHPHHAKSEVEVAGFENARLLSIEGPIWMIPGLKEQLEDDKKKEKILEFLEQTETDETLVGASGHFAVVACK